MSDSEVTLTPIKNQLFTALPEKEGERLRLQLAPTSLHLSEVSSSQTSLHRLTRE
jgi:hypothetical protein